MVKEQPEKSRDKKNRQLNKKSGYHKVFLIVAIVLYIASSSGSKLGMRLVLRSLEGNIFYLQQMTVTLFIPLTFVAMCIEIKKGSLSYRAVTSTYINSRFAVMALLDCIATYLAMVGTAHTSMAMQTMLPQGVIPISMMFSSYMLMSRYTTGQIGGAVAIITGASVASLSMISGDSKTSSSGSSAPDNNPQSGESVLYALMVFFSNFPMALSGILKELVMQHKGEPISVWHICTVVSFYQAIIGFVLAPLGMSNVPASEIPEQMYEGTKCLLGDLTIGPGCRNAGVYFLLFTICVAILNVSMLMVVQFGSCSLMFMASALVLPIANIANSFPVIMGEYATPLDVPTIIGTLIILFGMFKYASSASKPKVKMPQTPELITKSGKKILGDDGNGLLHEEDDDYLFDIRSLLLGVPVGISAVVLPPIEKRLECIHGYLARWAYTARYNNAYDSHGDLRIGCYATPLMHTLGRHSCPASPSADDIASSPRTRHTGISYTVVQNRSEHV